MQAGTYRSDLRYIQTKTLMGHSPPWGYPTYGVQERIVGPFTWWFYRIQFWRFDKFKQFNVLRSKELRH